MERGKSTEWPRYGDSLIKELISGEERMPRDLYESIVVLRQEQKYGVLDQERIDFGSDLANLTLQGITEYRREVASSGDDVQYFRLTAYGATVAYAKGFISSEERLRIRHICEQNPYDPIR